MGDRGFLVGLVVCMLSLSKTRAEDTERKMKREFEELHDFLRGEEATRLSELMREAECCNNAGKAKTNEDIANLSRRVKDLEEKMEAQDAIRFLQVTIEHRETC